MRAAISSPLRPPILLQDHGEKESLSARPPLSYEDMGYTNVVRNGGAITTRCKRSNGWETPDHIDTNLEAEFRMLRLAPSPVPTCPLTSDRDEYLVHHQDNTLESRVHGVRAAAINMHVLSVQILHNHVQCVSA